MEHENGGFDCEFVEKPPKSIQCECPVCLLILREPYQATCCGYSFCKTCIHAIKDAKSPCPCCKKPEYAIFPNKGLQRSLNDFNVHCTQKRKGCQWVGELLELDRHLNRDPQSSEQLKGCDYIEIKCRYCPKYFERSAIDSHQSELCPERPSTCEHCKTFQSSFENLQTQHWPICGAYPILCPNNCGKTVRRENVTKHRRLCALEVVDCDFKHVGCMEKVTRKDRSSHLDNNVANHLLLQTSSYKSLIEEHKLLQQQVAELKKIVTSITQRDDHVTAAVSDEHDTFPRGFPNEKTRQDSEQRMAEPFEQIRKLEVKLILHELKDALLIQQLANFIDKYVSSFRFGPFHASILIGDVILEWRPNSLVIPRKIDKVHSKDNKAVLFANVHETPLDAQLPTVPLQYEGADRAAVDSSFNKIKDITREKDTLIDELADVVVRFNTKQHYGLFTNNCQHFVLDVLQVLGITNPEEAFRGKLKQHADLVIARSKKEAIVEFNSHEELDHHIKEGNVEEMSHDDLEFAYCHYLLFHAWGERFPYEDAWRCNPNECQVNKIARKLH